MTVKIIRNRKKNAHGNSLALYQALAKSRQFELAEKTEITLSALNILQPLDFIGHMGKSLSKNLQKIALLRVDFLQISTRF
jgi:hypothetical protein